MAERELDDDVGAEVLSHSTSSLALRGNFNHTVDDKGRVSLPAEFRRVLNERHEKSVVLTNYISEGARCVEGFALSEWLKFEDNLRKKSRFNPKIQKLENFYLSRAAECSIDPAGRILLPNHLRTYAALEREVTFTSSLHGFRLWDKRVWEYTFRAAEQALLENPEIFGDIDV